MKKTLPFLMLYGCALLAQTNTNSVLWKISGNGLKQPSYLFGTMHMVPAKQFTINDSVLKYFKTAKTLVLEINPDIPLKKQLELAKKIFLPHGKTIKDYMDREHYEQFYRYVRDTLKIKEKKIQRYFTLRPAFMESMILSETVGETKMYEHEFYKKARRKKTFVPLETVEEQMSILDSIPMEHLLPAGSDDYKMDKDYYKLLNAYLKQDLKGLDSLMVVEDVKSMEYNLLVKRNTKWVPKIEELINDKSAFIAVGCLHLTGDNGLISLLKARGYTVRPIYFTNKTR